MNKGELIVISGPSGVGKGTVLGKIMEKRKDFSFSVSATTRPPGREKSTAYTIISSPGSDLKR